MVVIRIIYRALDECCLVSLQHCVNHCEHGGVWITCELALKRECPQAVPILLNNVFILKID